MDKTCISLDEVADIAKAESYKTQFLEAIKAGKDIELDASNTTRIDTAVVQAILALFLSAQQKQIDVSWKAASETVKRVIYLLGLRKHLALQDG